ncbi:MAG: hypothetical protein RR860_05250, partial [Janthinobacterium sp.]
MKFQSIYTRKQLRDQFQFEDATLNNGIFHPPGTLSVFIFITENKTADRIQYINHLDGDILLMQGQTEGRTDHLLNNQTTNNFEILLFHRTDRNEHPDYGFRYEGKFQYIRHYGQRPTSFILQRHTGRQFKYGDKPTWRLALEAIQELGGRATAKEVTNYIQEKIPEYKSNNTGPDLRLISVNEYGRSAWASNRTPRRTDASNPIDALYRSNINGEPVYELYDPGKHGVWELIADHNGVMRPILSEISQVQKELEENYAFDASNEEDARKKRLISIALRQGQPKFRRALLDAYSSQCAVTKCKIPAILEAAH